MRGGLKTSCRRVVRRDVKNLSPSNTEPPKSATVHIVKTTPTAINVRWRITDDGNSPISKVILNYKMTYGEWAEQEVHQIN